MEVIEESSGSSSSIDLSNSHVSCNTDSISSTSHVTTPSTATTYKRKAGRKKFCETRHPIYRGVRERNGGKWVCEVRVPNKKSRIWLGTFPCPEMAARAYDVAALALRGKFAALNFSDSSWALPRAKSASARDIQVAALEAAEAFRPTTASSELRRVKSLEKLPETPPVNATATFFDEEATFNMPGFYASMAEGLLLTPPAMHERFDWDDVDYEMDFSLWSD